MKLAIAAAVTVVVAVWGLSACSSMHDSRLLSDPLQLVEQEDIRDASRLLLDQALGDDAERSALANRKLAAVLVKLRDGWEGFTVTRYYPHEYTSRQLLADLYWDIAKRASTEQSDYRYEVLTVLHDSRPTEPGMLEQAYQSALRQHGLENLTR